MKATEDDIYVVLYIFVFHSVLDTQMSYCRVPTICTNLTNKLILNFVKIRMETLVLLSL